MRDIAVSVIILGLLPVVLVQPYIGVLLWTWVSVMNPHKLAWNLAVNMPFAAAVAGTTLIGLVFTKDRRKIPWNAATITLLAFVAWMVLTTAFAIYPDRVGEMFSRVMKIQLMVFVTLMLLHTRRHVELFVWVIVGSLGFYGIKGGAYTFAHGGGGRVWGPPGGFIAGNNELALALVMTIPLMYYLWQTSENKWVRGGLVVAMLLCGASILGSQSRGALIAVSAMALMLWWRAKNKLGLGLLLAVVGPSMIAFMPSTWDDRMATIQSYAEDQSALGRINAWYMAFNLAKSRFLGSGFENATPELFAMYAPDPLDVHGPHSIYFQVLGEHGFIGLAIFLLFWLMTWRSAGWLYRHGQSNRSTQWASHLAGMVQVSLVGYLTGGAFLGLAYFDLPYDLMILAVVARTLVEQDLRVQLRTGPEELTTKTSVETGRSEAG